MDDENLKSWIDSVEAIREGKGLPTFDEVCQKAELTDEQVSLLSSFNSDVRLIIQVRCCQLLMLDNDGNSCLRSIAEKLEVLHGDAVSGAKTRFVEKMFGAHALPQITQSPNGFRIRPGSDELWSTCYELELIVDFVRAGYSVELEPQLQNGKKPEFLARNEADIYVEAKRLDGDRQMDIVFGEDPWTPRLDDEPERVEFTRAMEQRLERMVSRNVNDASAKFADVSVPHAIFILSSWPPCRQGNAVLTAIENFLSTAHPGLLGVAIDSYEGRSFWKATPEGINNTDYTHGSLPPFFKQDNSLT